MNVSFEQWGKSVDQNLSRIGQVARRRGQQVGIYTRARLLPRVESTLATGLQQLANLAADVSDRLHARQQERRQIRHTLST